MDINKIYNGNSVDILKTIEDNSIDCCITSPPYWGLRDYSCEGQIGLESNPNEYIQNLIEVFTEVKRVLKPEGTLWLNIGDTYYPHGGSRGNKSESGDTLRGRENTFQPAPKFAKCEGIKGKDLVGIPWMLAFALREQGWYLRQDIIWAKGCSGNYKGGSAMPESVSDRCTKSHEYLFLLAKSEKYYYDNEAVKEEASGLDGGACFGKISKEKDAKQAGQDVKRYDRPKYEKRNRRSVWVVSTKPFKQAHFATFPIELITPCVLAGCPENGIIIDPFFGAGTTGLVCLQNKRNYIGIELNTDFIKIAENRLEDFKKEGVQQKFAV
jgi:DNA modification methylase